MGHEKLIDTFDLNLAAPQLSACTMDLHQETCVLSLHRSGLRNPLSEILP